ncbi:hypothetical protein BSU04_44270 [Caballeronia sordidicola]|uniref:Uncharacterized protein n=1 Tax=Caballeronia sordidicola TaxID=196367 RepID=A0A226WLE6_CABSO|nr:hypothetical protein BSU04_44270 [Caballeronia sordidicola]
MFVLGVIHALRGGSGTESRRQLIVHGSPCSVGGRGRPLNMFLRC